MFCIHVSTVGDEQCWHICVAMLYIAIIRPDDAIVYRGLLSVAPSVRFEVEVMGRHSRSGKRANYVRQTKLNISLIVTQVICYI